MNLALTLLNETPKDKKCPNLRSDRRGIYCGKDLEKGKEISDRRRLVCDTYSLQIWCLEGYSRCMFYKGESLE